MRSIFRRWVPAMGLLGGGVAAIGAYWQAVGVTLSGALIASLATMVSTVRQAEFRDRLEDANAKLLNNAETIAHLVTGGDSFAYFVYLSHSDNIGLVINQGNYPLYDINFRMVDLINFSGHPGQHMGASLNVGNLAVRSSVTIASPLDAPNDRDYLDLNIFFNARNGFWAQWLRCRKVDGDWLHASRVVRNAPTGEHQVLYERIDEHYPVPHGEIKW